MINIDARHKRKLLRVIKKHLGRSNPIQVDELAAYVPLTDREIRKVVQELVIDFGHPIGSTTKGPHGFFFIIDEGDLEEAIKNLLHRKVKIEKRIDSLKQNYGSGISIPNIKINKSKFKTIINISNSIVINLS